MTCKLLPVVGLMTTATVAAIAFSSSPASAATFNLTVKGTDAIFLAGRTDVVIPPLDNSFVLARHNFSPADTPADFVLETFPQFLAATSSQAFSFSASGCVNYFIGLGCNSTNPAGFGPNGGTPDGSSLNSLAGISGYQGPQGALVGLFLDNNNPAGSSAPGTLDFRSSGIGTSFATLAPGLGQLFFIGDGAGKTFTAPTGATRLFLGIADGFGFNGAPGAYEDNDGAFQVAVRTSDTTESVPEPTTLAGLLMVGGLLGLSRRRQSVKA